MRRGYANRDVPGEDRVYLSGAELSGSRQQFRLHVDDVPAPAEQRQPEAGVSGQCETCRSTWDVATYRLTSQVLIRLCPDCASRHALQPRAGIGGAE